MAEFYSDEQLEKLQSIELEILKDFIKICDENGLDYFLVGGSAIGVIRHQGFIPWDDDIDVAMPRADYDKFLKISEQYYSDKYVIVNNNTHPDFPLMNTRWSLKGTKFVPEDFKYLPNKDDLGIFLDIFCQDNMPDDEAAFLKQGSRAWFWGKWLVLSGVKVPVLYMKGFKKTIIRSMCYIGHYLLKILHLKPRFFYKRAEKWMLKYKNENTARFGYMFDPQKYTSVLYKNDVFPTKKMKFEDIEVKVPNKIETYLETRYGDYMKLPPKEDRHIHPPYILDFGDY